LIRRPSPGRPGVGRHDQLGNFQTALLGRITPASTGRDNTVAYEGLKLQLPQSPMRAHYVKARVKVRDYPDGSLAILHGPRCLARYDAAGRPIAAPTAPSLASCSPPSRRGLEAPGVCRTQSATASLDRISTRGQGQAAGRDEETGFQVEQRNGASSCSWSLTEEAKTASGVVPLSPDRRNQKRTIDVLQKPDISKSYRQCFGPQPRNKPRSWGVGMPGRSGFWADHFCEGGCYAKIDFGDRRFGGDHGSIPSAGRRCPSYDARHCLRSSRSHRPNQSH